MDYQYEDIAKMIDHSLLNPTLTKDDLEKGIELALAYNTASVCIMPYYLKRCAQLLHGSTVKASTTIGFPHGGHTTQVKLVEVDRALEDGGEELDVVVNISSVLSGEWGYVEDEIAAIVQKIHAAGQKMKLIFENCYLQDEAKIKLCQICTNYGVDWVKTSTGYGTGGAEIHDLKLMIENTRPPVQVKAAGGVRDLDKLLEVRALGVTRIGASRTAGMLDECRQRLGLEPLGYQSTPSGY
ncbi:MAG: deoxyribose-phosphate aldolase [Lentisphaerae bacterium]|nr:MAG: deoxyribose-phosphate aldolase [Lentisphaerota bacterium]